MKTLKALTVALVAISATQPAFAGGFFGEGGLIRGDVGNLLERAIEKPITTPLARTGAVAGGTAAGAIIGGKFGQPEIGAFVGNQMGHCINDIFAGQNCGTRTPAPPVNNGPQWSPQPIQRFGNYCATPSGIFGPGPMNPIGSFCHAMTPYGPVPGRVIN